MSSAPVSIIVPTYREATNLPALVAAIEHVRCGGALELELLIVDDDSRDGTEAWFESLELPWVKLLVRRDRRGLSSAVIDGIAATTGEIVVVMDADLSHPPSMIPKLVDVVRDGAEMAIGSRFAPGGTVAENRSILRRAASRCATTVVRPLTKMRDPMSGFFAVRRDVIARGEPLKPIGYKIGLEIMVRCRCEPIVEIPIHFAERMSGESKLSFKECLRYAEHLRRMYWHVLVGRRFGAGSREGASSSATRA